MARSLAHGEAVDLIATWVDTVLPTPDTEDEEVCMGGGLGGLPLSLSEVAKAYDATAPLTSADQRRGITAPLRAP